MQGQPFLENLAVTPRGLAEFQRRGAGGPAKRAHEIGQVCEADVIGDFWIPIIGPLLGAGIAAYVYDGNIQSVLKARGQAPAAGIEERGRTVMDEE